MIEQVPVEMPFDIATAIADDAWRATAVWPLPLSASRQIMKRLADALDALSDTLPRDQAEVVVLSSPWLLSAVGALADAAAQIEAAASRKICFIGREPVLARFSPGERDDATAEIKAGAMPAIDVPKHAGLRRLARTVSLNRAGNLPRALTSPDHVAISHNSLLMDVARRSRKSVAFRHGAEIVATARNAGVTPDERETAELARKVSDGLLSTVTLSSPYRERLAEIASPIIYARMVEAATDLANLRRFVALPASVWSGSAGYYPARAIAIEVRRRGGEVTVFDHGGSTGMFERELLAFGEFRLATRFVTTTHGVCRLLRLGHQLAPMPANKRPKIVGHDGEDVFASAMRLPARPNGARPRVAYPLAPFSGFRQYYPCLLPDVVYYDFLMRTVGILNELPIDLICKPRPGANKSHVVERIAKADFRLFEFVLPEVDVVLFDDVHSTTFWQTLCSDRGVVLIDLGLNRFVPEIAALIRQRCCVVTARFNDRNMPSVDAAELADAVDRASKMPVDPSPFRVLLAHDPAGSEALEL